MNRKRKTVQQQIILDTLMSFHTHPTVEEVHAEIKKKHPSISKTTVYRNLHQLALSGEIRRVSLPNDLGRYDRRTTQHYHFVCRICGGLFDVDIEYLQGINESVQAKYGFQVDEHDVIFTGICPQCIENGAQI